MSHTEVQSTTSNPKPLIGFIDPRKLDADKTLIVTGAARNLRYAKLRLLSTIVLRVYGIHFVAFNYNFPIVPELQGKRTPVVGTSEHSSSVMGVSRQPEPRACSAPPKGPIGRGREVSRC